MPATRLLFLTRAAALVVFLLAAAAPALAANALANHPSPYLAMHGDDPVAWRDWGPAVLAEARESGRPILISSGYFACHWCHVMQRESYQDPEIAALMNRHFVPVKLDRELHPALDDYLIGFTERTAGQAGWPLNVFLSPEGYPLLGLTYAPPAEFSSLLERVSRVWERDAANLTDLARRAAQERAAEGAEGLPRSLPDSPALRRALVRHSLMLADDMSGGFGQQSRFPQVPNLTALLELHARAPDPELAAFLTLTLDAMAGKGLRDHLGGGFFRYTVDPDWRTPHFEKMLYDQALLVPLYLRAAEVLDRPDDRAVARDTLDFMLKELATSQGGLIASLSAVDGDGVEGGYYLWRAADLQHLLTPDEERLAARVWGIEGPPTLEAGHLPMPLVEPEAAAEALGLPPGQARALLASAREKLLAARTDRTLPRDDKLLAGWNGLALSALARGAAALHEPRYREAARALRGFLVDRLWTGEVLLRAAAGGRDTAATLEDYAHVARGLADWARLDGSAADLALALRITARAFDRFYGDGGWRLDADPLLPLIPPETALADGPLPSPAAVLIGLALEHGDPALAARARSALEASTPAVAANPFNFAGQALLLATGAATVSGGG